MKSVFLHEPAWKTTFPHRVEPLTDEWLVSVLLRCDEKNCWESGESFRYLLRSTQHPGFGSTSSLLIFPLPLLESLAHLLMTTVESLLETTYNTELTNLYGFGPNPRLLLGFKNDLNGGVRHESNQRRMSNKRKIHLCPKCIAQTRTIGRTAVLPHLQYCPIHQVAFQECCICGMPLMFFVQGRSPFTCYACGMDWAKWPQIAIPQERKALERDIFALYAFFLEKGTADLRIRSIRLARRTMRKLESLELKLTGRRIKSPATHSAYHFSLEYLIDILISVDISPDDITNCKLRR